MTTSNYLGSDCTGSNGDLNRVLTLSNTRTTLDTNLIIVVDTATLHPTVDFTIDHNDSASEITFLNKLWDTQNITVNYLTTAAGNASSGATGILPLDTQLLINEINYFGDNVTVRAVTDDDYSKWGDAEESIEDTENLKAFVNILTQNDQEVKEGIFQAGDKKFFFKSNQGNLNRGNRIYHDSKWYEIDSITNYTSGDVQYAVEVVAKKV